MKKKGEPRLHLYDLKVDLIPYIIDIHRDYDGVENLLMGLKTFLDGGE